MGTNNPRNTADSDVLGSFYYSSHLDDVAESHCHIIEMGSAATKFYFEEHTLAQKI